MDSRLRCPAALVRRRDACLSFTTPPLRWQMADGRYGFDLMPARASTLPERASRWHLATPTIWEGPHRGRFHVMAAVTTVKRGSVRMAAYIVK
jgi:hypothetical protein